MSPKKNPSTTKELMAHVARIEGQLAAVRTALQADDCSKVARTLLAASRSLSSLRAACINEFISRKVYPNTSVKDEQLLADVRSLIKA
jgi:DNA-binding FrmR family transcriptional regulator